MRACKEEDEVDWVQLTAPRSVEQVKRAREAVYGQFSIMQGYMDPPFSNQELLALGTNLAWMPRPTHDVTYVALYDFIEDFMERGTGAWVDFRELHKENPYLSGALKIGGIEVAKQLELKEKYITWDSLEKYERSPGRNPS